MPAVAKKNKKTAPESDVKMKQKTELQPKKTVVSGQLQKAISNKKRKSSKKFKKPERGVMFIKHLPHGFFEEQLKNYFSQFGAVTKVRLARSVRSGNSKGFAYIEFAVPEVAQIAAETMDNYLMFRKIVKAAYIPPEEQRYNYFKSGVRSVRNKLGKAIYVSHLTRATNKKVGEINNWTEENYAKRMRKSTSKLNRLKRKYADLGIDFDEHIMKPEILPNDKSVESNDSTIQLNESAVDLNVSNISTRSDSDADNSNTNQPGSLLLVKKRKFAKKSNEITLKSLLEETIEEDDSSSDDDFQPDDVDFDPDDTLKSNNTTTSVDEKYEKPVRQSRKVNALQSKVDRAEKMLQRNPLGGKIVKKGKKSNKKPAKVHSHALKEKMKDSARLMVQERDMAHSKGKDLKRQKKKRRV